MTENLIPEPVVCTYCGTRGHDWPQCPQKADDEGDELMDRETQT